MRRTLICLAVLFAIEASAATLCGTVRDATTQAPVSGAAVFLLDDTGSSIVASTGTTTDGTWCLDAVAPGTYSIVVERDDYQLARVDGIVVDGTATAVDVGVRTALLFAPVVPNPASDRASLRWRVPRGTAFTLEVFDLRGRRVAGWEGRGTDGDMSLVWGLRSFDGRPLATGTYFVALRSGADRVVRKVSLVR